jgi:uncharacterized protein YndB with AHSA1/START domain
MEKDFKVTKKLTINAPAEKVWETTTNPELTKKYMYNCKAETDWKPGSKLNWVNAEDGKIMVTGKILNIEKEKILKFTSFDPNGKEEDKPENHTTVTYKIEEDNGKTLMTITDENLDKEKYDKSVKGWDFAAEGLKKTAESL